MAIANLLGVAGTDVPIRDIKKLMMPFTVNNDTLIIFDGIEKSTGDVIECFFYNALLTVGCQWICVYSK